MSIAKLLLLVVIAGISLSSCSPEPGGNKRGEGTISPETQKPEPALMEIGIEGGFGYLRSMGLKKDGTGEWVGYEPGRRMASHKGLSLTPGEIQKIWSLAQYANLGALEQEYHGGRETYKVVFVFEDGSKSIQIHAAEEDRRPAELKELLDALWQTRR